MTSLIQDCRLISPGLDLEGAAIAMDSGRIHQIYPPGTPLPQSTTVYSAQGALALPGFIDIHVHGANGFDVSDGTLEAVRGLAAAKLQEGVTTFCPTTLTLPEPRLDRILEAVAEYGANPSAARIAGVHLEGPFLNPDWAGAHDPAQMRKPDMAEITRLQALTRIALVSLAVEEEGGLALTRQLAEAGIVPSCGHSGATFQQLRQAKQAGLRHLTHFGNRMLPLHHREVGGIGAGLLDDDLYVELICDRVHLCEEMLALLFKCKPIHKILLITDAIRAAGLASETFDLGGREGYLEGGAAYLRATSTLAGSLLRFNEALKNAWEISGLPLSELIKTCALNQAETLGLEKVGKLEAGYQADIVLLDSEFAVQAVFLAGERRL